MFLPGDMPGLTLDWLHFERGRVAVGSWVLVVAGDEEVLGDLEVYVPWWRSQAFEGGLILDGRCCEPWT